MLEEPLLRDDVLKHNAVVPPVRENHGRVITQLRRPCGNQPNAGITERLDREGNRTAHGVEIARPARQVTGNDTTVVGERIAQ